MSKKMLETLVSFRVTNDEMKSLHKAAEKSHMTVSEYLRGLVSVAPLLKIEYKLGGEE